MPTQEEYNIVKARQRNLDIKIELLNYTMQTVDELSGTVIGTPTFTNDGNSDTRRTCTFSLYYKDSSFDIKSGSKLWMDKYAKISIGINGVYTKVGVYIINNPSTSYSSTNNTITIQGIDLMNKLNGYRDGYLQTVGYVIPQDYNVRNAIIATIKEAGFNRYIVEECEINTPYEIKVEVGGTYFDILKQLRDILPNYEIYFDEDGVFHYNKIPMGHNEQVFVDDDIWNKVIINWSSTPQFTDIKNVIEVYGKTHEVNYYTEQVVVEQNVIKLTIDGLDDLYSYVLFGFTIPNTQTITSPTNIMDLNEYRFGLMDDEGKVPTLETGVYYVVKFVPINSESGTSPHFQFLGEVSPYAIIKETRDESDYNINKIGEISIVLSGGEYDNINSTNLAMDRAKWELYQRCQMHDSINITCIPIYWLDVNKLIEITLPNKQGTEKKEKYIIKSINTTYGENGTQTITAIKYYPYYEE